MRTFAEIKAEFDGYREGYRRGDAQIRNELLMGVTIGEFQRACGGSAERRHEVQRYLFGMSSAKNLPRDIRYALMTFVDPQYDNENKSWKVRGGLYEDVTAVMQHIEDRKAYERQLLAELGE